MLGNWKRKWEGWILYPMYRVESILGTRYSKKTQMLTQYPNVKAQS